MWWSRILRLAGRHAAWAMSKRWAVGEWDRSGRIQAPGRCTRRTAPSNLKLSRRHRPSASGRYDPINIPNAPKSAAAELPSAEGNCMWSSSDGAKKIRVNGLIDDLGISDADYISWVRARILHADGRPRQSPPVVRELMGFPNIVAEAWPRHSCVVTDEAMPKDRLDRIVVPPADASAGRGRGS